jgi:hypothetical protein
MNRALGSMLEAMRQGPVRRMSACPAGSVHGTQACMVTRHKLEAEIRSGARQVAVYSNLENAADQAKDLNMSMPCLEARAAAKGATLTCHQSLVSLCPWSPSHAPTFFLSDRVRTKAGTRHKQNGLSKTEASHPAAAAAKAPVGTLGTQQKPRLGAQQLGHYEADVLSCVGCWVAGLPCFVQLAALHVCCQPSFFFLMFWADDRD